MSVNTNVILVSAAVLTAGVLAGCGDDDSTNTSTTGGAGAEGGGGAGAAAGGVGGTGNVGGASGGAGGSAGGAGGEGGSATMGASQACQMCVADLYSTDPTCAANVQTCDADPACNAWKDCSENCFNEDDTPACYEACDQGFPHDDALSAPLLACTCTACEAVCPASCAM
jgi:hypothetical protein